MSWCFRVFKDCRVCLVLRGAGASVLIETGFERLFRLSNVGFRTIQSLTLKTINEVGLFVSGWLVFNVHKYTAKFVHWLKASRYTKGFKGIFYSFWESSAVWDGHQSAPFTILRCRADSGWAFSVFVWFFGLFKCPVRVAAVLQCSPDVIFFRRNFTLITDNRFSSVV